MKDASGLFGTDREKFEAWVRSLFAVEMKEVTEWSLQKSSNGEYFADVVRHNWQAFQAGIAASGRDELLESLKQIEAECSGASRRIAYAAIKKFIQ
jgi:hypothetical protein